MVEISDRLVLKLLPVAVLHVVSSQTFNQVEYNCHISDFFSKSLPALDETNFLIYTLDLSRKHFVLFNEDISLDLSPEFLFPVIVLQINKSNKIP